MALHVPSVLKSGKLNLLEPSGPVQACSGIALPLYTFKTVFYVSLTKPTFMKVHQIQQSRQQFHVLYRNNAISTVVHSAVTEKKFSGFINGCVNIQTV